VDSRDPDALAAEYRRLGYRAASCPPVHLKDTERIRAIKQAFSNSDIVIAEVAAWVNPLHPDSAERHKNLEIIMEALAIADELEAVCCTTVAGSFDGSGGKFSHVGYHERNFSDDAFDAVVQWVRLVLKEARPSRTKLTLEMSPWTILDGPESYLKILKAVDRPGLAVHLDPANAVVNPRTYYSTTELVNRCFDLLGPWIRSCHAKDIRHALDERTVAIAEVRPGKGVLDYRTYLRRIEELSVETPLILEHLPNLNEFAEAATFIRDLGREIGVTN
jgi:sugar phosphate isomerase/epimerase